MRLIRDCGQIKMENAELAAETVQKRMREIRRDLRTNVSDIVTSANEFLDWKSYIYNHPWIIAGIAAVAGYVVIPRRSRELEVATATQQSVDSLTEQVRNQVDAHKKSSPALPLAAMVTPI